MTLTSTAKVEAMAKEAGLDEGLLSLFLLILVYMENPYKRNK